MNGLWSALSRLCTWRLQRHVSSTWSLVGNFTAPGGGFYSVTTSKHVSLARAVADTVMLPELFSELFGRK